MNILSADIPIALTTAVSTYVYYLLKQFFKNRQGLFYNIKHIDLLVGLTY